MHSVCVIGLGYIGLPTAIVAAHHGFLVAGFDVDQDRVARIAAGEPIFDEPELAVRLKEIQSHRKFTVSTILTSADYYIICVPTPLDENKYVDLRYVWQAIDSIAEVMQSGSVVILESTVSIGVTQEIAYTLSKKTGLQEGRDFYVAHCPERVLPGNIFYELVHNTRIIGGISKVSTQKAYTFYKKFVKAHVYLTNAKTAEMVKLVENSYRDVAIAFAHQVADMAYAAELNPFEVIELANKHPRVHILQPTCGVGGHCIAVDPWFLIRSFSLQQQHNVELIRSARSINDQKPRNLICSIRQYCRAWKNKHKRTCNILALGLTYKPNVDDMRESPALWIAHQLNEMNECQLVVNDPHVAQKDIASFGFKTTASLHTAVEQADVIVCLVKHRYFETIARELVQDKTIFDTCGLFYVSRTGNGAEQAFDYWPTIDHFTKPMIDHVQENHS